MAQAGFTPIQLYRTTTASAQPTAGNLAAGELAINLTDKKLYAKDASNNVFVLADASSGGTTATNLAGGAAGSVPYQTGASTTTFLGIGTAAQVLQVNSGATAPEWVSSSGTGNVARTTSPSFTTPSLGAATALSINSLTLTTSTGTFTLANGKTLTVNNSLTLSGTDATTMTFPSTNATIARTDAAQTFTGTQTVRAAATQDAVALAGRAGGTSSFVSTLTPTTLSASRTVTLPDADTTVPVATQVLTFTGPTAGRTITLPDANFTVARSDAAQSFTGTQTFLSNPVLDAGTANGVLYLDGSKVVTSGSALTFDGTNFAVSGTGIFGAAATKLRTYSDSTYSGIFNGASLVAAESVYMGAGGLYFNASGSEQMRLNSTGLGIGTSSPGAKLDVQGPAVTEASIRLTSLIDGTIATPRASSFSFRSGSTPSETARIASFNRFGNVNGGDLVFSTADTSNVLQTRATIDASGNLGLGVTPSAWGLLKALDISTAGGFFGYTGQTGIANNAFFDGTGWKYKNTDAAGFFRANALGFEWHTAPSGTAGNAISFTQAMTLDANGRLGIGVTSPSSKLSIEVALETALAQSNDGITLRASTGSTDRYTLVNFSGSGYAGNVAQIGAKTTAIGSGYADSAGMLIASTKNTTDATPVERVRIPAAGGVVVGTAALATTATDGFLYVPTCAGTPTGTPTTQTGTAPIVVNTTNNKLYFYSGGQWRDAGP